MATIKNDTDNSLIKSSVIGLNPFKANAYNFAFINIKEAAIKTGRKESNLRNLAKSKKIRWYMWGNNPAYFFIEQEILQDIKNLPSPTKKRPVPQNFQSSLTRLEFALLYKAMVKQNVIPASTGGKILFCKYLVSAGVYNSITTAQKMFSEFELKTTQAQKRIKEKLIKNLTTVIHNL